MSFPTEDLLPFLVLAAAILYSSVGHGGASGYLAAMALVGVSPGAMRPTALLLNIIVSAIALVRFARAGCFSWRLFWPFIVLSIPAAHLGGALKITDPLYRKLVAAVLVYAAIRMIWDRLNKRTTNAGDVALKQLPRLPALFLGGVIGLLSGLTGTGGGIFLSPLVILLRWADARQAAGVSAAFIFVNSIAGIAGYYQNYLRALLFGGPAESLVSLPIGPLANFHWLALAAVVGGIIGSEIGTRRADQSMLRLLLAIVLLVAAAKLGSV